MLQRDEDFSATLGAIKAAFALRKPDAVNKAMAHLMKYQSFVEPPRRTRGQRKPSARPIPHDVAVIMRQRIAAIQDIIVENIRRFIPKPDVGPTPERASRPSSCDNIMSLEECGRIMGEHARAAREIQSIINFVTVSSQAKCQRFERSDPSPESMSLRHAEMSHKWSKIYLPWHVDLTSSKDGKRKERLTMLMLVDGLSLDRARCLCRMGYDRGHEYFVDAMDRFIRRKQLVGKPPDSYA